MWGGRRVPDQVRDDQEAAAPPWVALFLAGLIVTGSVREAVAEAGIDFETAWALRSAEPEFAMYWDRALRVHEDVAAGLALVDAVELEEGSVH
jgi:hypothetical protein